MHRTMIPYIMLVAPALILGSGSCGDRAKEPATRSASATPKVALSDKPLAAFQTQLLELAFETATSIPVNPHIKDRSKAQQAVVTSCLALDQPKRALLCTERIDDWACGICYADLAFYCAQKGYAGLTQDYLDRATEISEKAEDWRRDSIRVRIAQTHTLLGHSQEANEFEKEVVDSETGKVAGTRAMLSDENSFDEQMKAMNALIASGNFDTVKNALQGCAQLFDRAYGNPKRRALAEEKIKSSWGEMPIVIRLNLLMDLADSALKHADSPKALQLVNESQGFLSEYEWPLEYRIQFIGKLSGLRHRAGDTARARADADEAFALFDKDGAKIVNIYRAGALRPLAEAYQCMGNTAAALSVYKRAIEEGVQNPNSRPRAEDLSATCASMALHKVEPDAELWSRIRQIKERLADPW